MLLPLLVLLLVALGVVGTWRRLSTDPPWERPRAIPRRRRTVGALTYRAALRLGFRYSGPRDALVLRVVGRRYGPVLRRRDAHREPDLAGPPRIPAESASPTPPSRPQLTLTSPPLMLATPAAPTDRVLDVACLPLPQFNPSRRLWQLTAVDMDARYVWADVVRTRGGGGPSADVAIDFVRRVARDLDERGLRLDAIVVRAGSTHRRPLFDGAAVGGIRLLHVPPGLRRERLAARMHERIVVAHWRPALAQGPGRSASALRRDLHVWVEEHNARTPTRAASREADPAPAPADALNAQTPDPAVH